ncbi:programmed cell death protein 2 [Dipodascopsis tothii]|uniref:programmed cell death protein 2 n=1 Tax=Dipodascopsis tothii TaxID=44089 RepID=UPI0034CD17CC
MSESASGRTSVLLGVPDEEVLDTPTAFDTRIGGQPIWLQGTAADGQLGLCKVCGGAMAMLLQVNAALEDTTYERMIYVFTCRNKKCRRKEGSVRAFRGVLRDLAKEAETTAAAEAEARAAAEAKAQAAAAPKPAVGSMIFGDSSFGSAASPFGAAPFGAGPSPFAKPAAAEPAADLAQSFADKLKVGLAEPAAAAPAQPWQTVADPYSSFYLYVESEVLSNEPDKEVAALAAQAEALAADGAGPSGGDEWSAVPESSGGLAIDHTFQKFADLVNENPDQVVRYERGGAPVLYSKTDALAKKLAAGGGYSAGHLPACPRCRSHRVFELQLMPYLIEYLEDKSGVDILNGMEWGTIMVGTCMRDCVPPLDGHVGYVEEWVGVQWEEIK